MEDSELPAVPPRDISTQQLYYMLRFMNKRWTEMDQRLKDQSTAIADLLDAWHTANSLLRLVRAIAVLGAAVAAFWAGIRGAFNFGGPGPGGQ